jgi:cobalamin biosynthesis Co2+ chelatase CbiK
MKAFDGGFFDRAIHSLNLAVCPRMPHLREAVFDPVLAANAVEDVREGVRIQGAVGEFHAVIGQHGVDPVVRRLQQVAQKLRRVHLARPLLQSHKDEFRRAVNGDKETQLALR